MVARPRLRTILLIVNLVILALPLAGIGVLRIYESALVRQTESELIAQGAFIAASYRAAFSRIANARGYAEGDLPDYGRPMTPKSAVSKADERWRPRTAMLDLATDAVLPPQSGPIPAATPGDPLALAVGEEITPILRDAQVVTLAGIRVLDYQGILVASTATSGGLGMAMNNSSEVQRALDGEHVSLLRQRISDEPPPSLASISRGTRVRVYLAMPIVHNGRILGAVVLSRTPSNIGRALYGKRWLLLQLGLVLLAVVSLLSIFTSLTISRPVRAVIAQARRAVRGETGAVIPLARPVTREIAQLSEAVAGMATTLEQRADYIRTFAAHVSHEFKTPLTAIQGATELLRDHFDSMSATERGRFLDNLHEDADRLQRLVRRLLDLARADTMTSGTDTAAVGAVLAPVAQRSQRQGLRILVEVEPDLPPIAMAADTLDSILGSLLDNTRQHGGESVTLRAGRSGENRVEIRIEDDGPGITPANSEQIFEPFFTTARKQGGTGLGLSVVKSLVTAHRGDIELLHTATGAAFRLRLVVAS